MTLRFRFSKSDMITAAGVAMRPIEINDKGGTFERVGQPGITEAFSHQELAEMMRRPDTTYFAGYFDVSMQQLRSSGCKTSYSDYTQPEQAVARYREAYCLAMLQLKSEGLLDLTHESFVRHRPKIQTIAQKRLAEGEYGAVGKRAGAKIVTRKPPGSTSALKWLRAYKRSGYLILALLPKTSRSGNRDRRWCPRAEGLMNQVIEIYADTQRPTKVQAIKATQALFEEENRRRDEHERPPLAIPSASSIKRRLDMADPFYVRAKRYGIAAAASHFTLFSNGPDVQRPMERVEMDENRLDVISLLTLSGIWDHLPQDRQERFETGRRWLYIAIDCATKCVVSMRLAETPNADDAIRALRDIFEDKTRIAEAAGCESSWHHHGGIGTLVTDMGSAFASEEFQGTASSLAITAALPPAGIPWLRGFIESFFRTLGHQLMPLLAGRTFFDTVQRGDYPSDQLACLCDDDLIKVLLTFIVDIYHAQPHGSLKGETPNAAWARLVAEHGTPPIPDGLTLRKAFGRPLQRKLRGDGVRFSGLSYSCEALREAYLHSPVRNIEIRADLNDIGWIAVRVGATWYPAMANEPGFDGVSYDQLREGMRATRHQHKRDAMLDAPKVQRAIERISEMNRQAFALRELTPFHMTDLDVARSEASLHYAIRSDAQRLGHIQLSSDPLAHGICISPRNTHSDEKLEETKADPTLPPQRKTAWRIDDDS